MDSKRSTLLLYGVILVLAVGVPTLMVTFPETADRLVGPLSILVASAGVLFVAAGLFRRDIQKCHPSIPARMAFCVKRVSPTGPAPSGPDQAAPAAPSSC